MIDKNHFTVTGNLAAAPELRHTPEGTPVVNARIIRTDSHKDKESGEWKKGEPMGIDFVVWGAYAEAFVKKVQKGTAVLLEGPFKPNNYEKDGTKYYGLRLRVEEWQVIAQPGERSGQPAAKRAGAARRRNG